MQIKYLPLTFRIFSGCLSIILGTTFSIPVQAQDALNLPVPGSMVTSSPSFEPMLLKCMTIHPEDPLKFDFIIDSGNTNFTQDEIRKESEKLVKYFMASMTIPKDDLWVNLSPFEKDRIIPEKLGKTELGRDMLAQDYILKQLTASMIYPEKELGKRFWDKIYQQVQEQFNTTEIPLNTFNKVWILPETATIYEHEQTVYIIEAKFKVMLDQDYQAMRHEKKNQEAIEKQFSAVHQSVDIDQASSDISSFQSSIIREIIIPAIEEEVNQGKHFAPLRQIYHSLILAKWYKETVKNSLFSSLYADKNMIEGIRLEEDARIKEDGQNTYQSSVVNEIYKQYMEAYEKGVFDYIKEDYDRSTQELIPRKYVSGGLEIGNGNVHNVDNPTITEPNNPQGLSVMMTSQPGSSAASKIRTDESMLTRIKHVFTFAPLLSVQEINAIYISGTFNNWTKSDPNFKMTPTNNGDWIIELELAPGNHEYKFIVEYKDGNSEWLSYPQDPFNERLPSGNNNYFVRIGRAAMIQLKDAENYTREELGEKGKSLSELSLNSIPVPESFLITVEMATNISQYKDLLKEMIADLGKRTQTEFGNPDSPLFITIRSSSDRPYHGGLHSIIWLGLTEEVLEALKKTEGEDKALWRYVGFLESYGNEVLQIPGIHFANVRRNTKDPQKIIDAFKKIIEEDYSLSIPTDPYEQVLQAAIAVNKSGELERILAFRKAHGENDPAPVALIVSQMVNTFQEGSGIAIISTHDHKTGDVKLAGEFVEHASGLDLMQARATMDFKQFSERYPQHREPLNELIQKILKIRNQIPQDIEFVFLPDGKLQVVQSQPQQGWPSRVIMRLVHERARKENILPWLELAKIIMDASLETVPKRAQWITDTGYDLESRLLIGTADKVQKVLHPLFEEWMTASPSAKPGVVGKMVLNKDQIVRYPHEPLIFIAQVENTDLLQEMLFANKISAVVVPQNLRLGHHVMQMMEYFKVPLIEMSPREEQKILERLKKDDAKLSVFYGEEGVVAEFQGEGETTEEHYKFFGNKEFTLVTFQDNRVSYRKMTPGKEIDLSGARKNLREKYQNKDLSEIMTAFSEYLYLFNIDEKNWQMFSSAANYQPTAALENGVTLFVLYEIITQKLQEQGKSPKDAVLEILRWFFNKKFEVPLELLFGPVSNPDEVLKYKIINDNESIVRWTRLPNYPVISFHDWAKEYAQGLTHGGDLGRFDTEKPQYIKRKQTALEKLNRFYDFLQSKGVTAVNTLQYYKFQPDVFAGAIDQGGWARDFLGLQFDPDQFTTVLQLFAEFEQQESSGIPDPATLNGGIDLNEISLKRQGTTDADIQFDHAAFTGIINLDITGFTPTITNIAPVSGGVLPLLGLKPAKKPEKKEQSLSLGLK